MTRKEQKEFVTSICNNLKKALQERVKDVPENWDGHELRLWAKDYYSMHFIIGTMSGSRMRDYKNEISINPKIT